jgi:hypothetical protein
MATNAMAAGAIVFIMLETGGDGCRRVGNIRCEVGIWIGLHRYRWKGEPGSGRYGDNARSKRSFFRESQPGGPQRWHQTYSERHEAKQNQRTAADETGRNSWDGPGRRERKAERQRPDNVLMFGRGQSRHIGSYNNNNDGEHRLEFDPVGVTLKRGIARPHLKQWQRLTLQSAGNQQNAAKHGKLEEQEAPVFRSNHAREIPDKVPCQQHRDTGIPAGFQNDTHRECREPRKAAQDGAAKRRVSSGMGPTPMSIISAGNPPAQTAKASRCAIEAKRPATS